MSSSRRSRNGCANCRAKRQKCDEAQPACLRCQRAGLECRGYINAQELRWRPVDKRDLSARAHARTQKSSYNSNVSRCSGPTLTPDEGPLLSNGCQGWQDSLTAGSISSAESECLIVDEYLPTDINEWTSIIGELPSDVSNADSYNLPVDFDAFDLDFEGLLPMPAVIFHSGIPTTEPQENSSTMIELDTATLESSYATEKARPSPKTTLCPTAPVSLSLRLSLIQPSRNVHDMLIAHFDRKTCGILSIKDGPVENPWRTLILPLSNGSQAVEHAITCMAAFHGAYDSPDLYTHGTVDMDKNYKCLALEEKKQPLIPALAAWVGLAFAEGWKTPTMSRLTPMVNARRLLAERLTANRTAMSLTKTDTARLKYLINAFVFVHTIGGITSRPDEEAPPLPAQVVSFLTPSPDEARMETDPLLGCAASLFPLIDNVVSIVQKARQTQRNSLTLVSRASEVYEQLDQWQPPRLSVMNSLEDRTQVIQHSIQTAQALRYATLLHLHQAVPEIPSESSADLARKVLLKLASIPSSSVVTNLHIFPLLAASGELTDPEDREWAEQRWHAIIGRLRVKNVDTCWDIVQATWARRDIHEAAKVPAGPRADFEMDPAYTVRGKLHWLSVMDDRNWQVFVG